VPDRPTPREDGVSDTIGELYVMGTWRCNLRCRMCPMWGARGWCREDPGGETLDVGQLVAWVADAPDALRPRTVTISGGEPLLWRPWSALARGLADLGLRVALTTNATLLADVPDPDLANLRQINLSLDGPAVVLEAIDRGGEDTLRRAVDGLRRVQRFRAAIGRPGLRLLTVITAEGVGHLEALLAHLEGAGITLDSLLFQHPMVLTDGAADAQRRELTALVGPGIMYWDSLVGDASAVDVDALLAELEAIRARYPGAVIAPALTDDETRAYYTDPAWTPPGLGDRCLGMWRDLSVTPTGDVWICPGHPVGNVADASLEAIVNGERARTLRRHVHRHGLMPGCRACFAAYNYR